MIKTRNQACHILGVSIQATESEIKAAYKSLVKVYHPDSGNVTDAGKYNEIVEAYNFLCQDTGVFVIDNSTKIVGNTAKKSHGKSRANEYARFQKKVEKQRQQRANDFEEMTKEYSKQIEKQEEDYKRAMEAIETLRAARAIQAMIWANGLERGQNLSDEVE